MNAIIRIDHDTPDRIDARWGERRLVIESWSGGVALSGKAIASSAKWYLETLDDRPLHLEICDAYAGQPPHEVVQALVDRHEPNLR